MLRTKRARKRDKKKKHKYKKSLEERATLAFDVSGFEAYLLSLQYVCRIGTHISCAKTDLYLNTDIEETCENASHESKGQPHIDTYTQLVDITQVPPLF